MTQPDTHTHDDTSVMSSGGDDRRVLLWHMEKAIHGRSKPVKLKGEHRSNIFCLAFDSSNTKVFSGGEFQINAADLSLCLCESVTKMCCGLMGNVCV